MYFFYKQTLPVSLVGSAVRESSVGFSVLARHAEGPLIYDKEVASPVVQVEAGIESFPHSALVSDPDPDAPAVLKSVDLMDYSVGLEKGPEFSRVL